MNKVNTLIDVDEKEPEFKDFYKLYPRKVDPKGTEKLWNKLTLEEKRKSIIDIHQRIELHEPWQNGKNFIPASDRFIRRKKFNEEIIIKRTKEDEQLEAEDGTIHARFWTMLKQFYGDKFTRSFGEKMPKAWLSALHDLTQKDCSRILRYLANDSSEFMPDLPKINRIKRIGKEHNTFPQLPRPKRNKQVSRQACDDMRTIIKKTKPSGQVKKDLEKHKKAYGSL